MKKFKLFFDILRLPVDLVMIFSALWLAYKLRPVTDLIPGIQYVFLPEYLPSPNEYLAFSIWSTVFLVIIFMFNRLYSTTFHVGLGKTALKVVLLVTVWLMFILSYYFLILHELFFSRIALAHIWIFAVVFILIGRGILVAIQGALHRFGIGQIKLLFIGSNALAHSVYQALKKDKKYKVLGALSEQNPQEEPEGFKILGTLNELESIVKKYQIDEIIQAESNLKHMTPAELLTFCRSHSLPYYLIPEAAQLHAVNVGMEVIDGIPLLNLKQTPLEGWGSVYKRVFDFLASLLGLIALSPFFLIIAIIIKLDSRGPVFYKSKRKYKDHVFGLYKFRSMVVDAEQQRAALLKQNERKGPLFKIKNDPRVTRFGRFLRKTSIDELPQLINVLKGDISLVGPRPHLPEEVAQYEAHHLGVFAIKPGITGLAQINGRSNLDFEDEIKLDFYYIENWSFWLDIKILFQTVGVIFKADGH